MLTYLGVDLGSTTTKAILLDEDGRILGRGLTNSRSNYDLAAEVARVEAFNNARFELLEREIARDASLTEGFAALREKLVSAFRLQQYLRQLETLKGVVEEKSAERSEEVRKALKKVLTDMTVMARTRSRGTGDATIFFRDEASSDFSRFAEKRAGESADFDGLMGMFDKSIVVVEAETLDLSFEGNILPAFETAAADEPEARQAAYRKAVETVASIPLEPAKSIGTGYGRARLPFPKGSIRSEILCHGLGAHYMFPETSTVLDIGGQDTKAIQVDEHGIVTSFQMNDRCAAGCGRYLGYIADEMNLGVQELGPLAQKSTRHVKINSTCTVFAGAELRERLMLGEEREDILAGLHRAIILRAMALLARSGGVYEQFTFTGGVARNEAAVAALRKLVEENYGERTINISADSIYTGAVGAALFAKRAVETGEEVSPDLPKKGKRT